MRYVKLFEEFSQNGSWLGVVELLKRGSFDEAKKILCGLIESDPRKQAKRFYDDWMSPPALLERECGISGISKTWRMPFGMKNQDIELLAMNVIKEDSSVEKKIEGFRFILDSFAEDNPELIDSRLFSLKDVLPPMKLYDIILGFTSMMNENDIISFVTNSRRIVRTGEMFRHPTMGQVSRAVVHNNGVLDEEYTNILTKLHEMVIERCGHDKVQWFPSIETMKLIIKKLEG